eukprot:2346954-Rhodomonas_salina.1
MARLDCMAYRDYGEEYYSALTVTVRLGQPVHASTRGKQRMNLYAYHCILRTRSSRHIAPE